jgi:hypothetical protein
VNRQVLQELQGETPIRIRWASTNGWTITDPEDEVLFSFDLPPVLFYMYAQSATLTRAAAAVLKEEMFQSLQAVVFDGDEPRVVRFVPDAAWFTRLREYAARNAEPLIASLGSRDDR